MENSNMENGEGNKVQILFKRVFNKQISKIMLGAVSGAIIGWLYWEFIGCNGGSCPLTSNPYKTVLIFTMMGAWVTYRK